MLPGIEGDDVSGVFTGMRLDLAGGKPPAPVAVVGAEEEFAARRCIEDMRDMRVDETPVAAESASDVDEAGAERSLVWLDGET